jgi:hypothetical protein
MLFVTGQYAYVIVVIHPDNKCDIEDKRIYFLLVYLYRFHLMLDGSSNITIRRNLKLRMEDTESYCSTKLRIHQTHNEKEANCVTCLKASKLEYMEV